MEVIAGGGGGAVYLNEVVKIFNIYIIILVANFTIILGDMLPFCFFLKLQNYWEIVILREPINFNLGKWCLVIYLVS